MKRDRHRCGPPHLPRHRVDDRAALQRSAGPGSAARPTSSRPGARAVLGQHDQGAALARRDAAHVAASPPSLCRRDRRGHVPSPGALRVRAPAGAGAERGPGPGREPGREHGRPRGELLTDEGAGSEQGGTPPRRPPRPGRNGAWLRRVPVSVGSAQRALQQQVVLRRSRREHLRGTASRMRAASRSSDHSSRQAAQLARCCSPARACAPPRRPSACAAQLTRIVHPVHACTSR